MSSSKLDLLNDDLLELVLVLLPLRDRIYHECVCRRWLRVALSTWSKVKSLQVKDVVANYSPGRQKTILFSVLRHASWHLISLDFVGSDLTLTRAELAEMVGLTPNLRRLHLTGAHLPDDSIMALSQLSCAQLSELNLQSCYSFPGKGKNPELGTLEESYLSAALTQLPQLQSLDLSRCDVTGICLLSLGPMLSSVSLGGTGRITLELRLLERFLQTHPHLREFRINYTRGGFTQDLPAYLARYCPGLQLLELSDLENCDFSRISGLPQLRTLCISQRWTHLSAEQQQLASLSDSALQAICQKCPLLESLSIRGYDLYRSLSADGLSAIGSLTQLTSLVLTDAHVIDDEILLRICQQLSRLQAVNLSNCAGVTDRSAALLGRHCPQLTQLKLTGCAGVTAAGLNALISSLPGRLEISAADTRVDPDLLVVRHNVTVETIQ